MNKEEVMRLVEKMKKDVEDFKLTQMEKQAKALEESAKKLATVEEKLQRVENGMKAYEHLDAALSELVENKIGTMREGNPTPGGTVKTTLTDIKHIVHVPVKEEEVTIDTSTNRGKILRLAAKGFFEDWRKAGEVSTELEKKGQAMNDKVVMMELANLCNLGYLGRTKRENQFVYKVPDEGVVFKP